MKINLDIEYSMLKTFLFNLMVYTCVLTAQHVFATSYEEEVSEILSQRITNGEVVWLEAGRSRFLAVFQQHTMEQPRGAAIIVHGMGGHPDWPEVVSPLRTGLPVTGWATLSIQMPVLEPGEPLSDYGRTMQQASNRIRSAVMFLREKQFLNIILIGHRFGATSAAYYLAENRSIIQALIGISMQSYEFLNPRLDLNDYLGRINVPVLDILGSRDFENVLSLIDERRQLARKVNKQNYQQTVIDGADHYFTGSEDTLLIHISDWLADTVPGPGIATDDKFDNATEPLNLQILEPE